MGGQNYQNTRNNASQFNLGVGNAATLGLKWQFAASGDISATAAVVGNNVYFPDWGGHVYKLNAGTGSVVWDHLLPTIGGRQTVARTSPAVSGKTLYIGDQSGNVIAMSAATGAELWRTKPNPGPFPVITASPVVYNGVVYVGVASSEEAVAANPSYLCCSARGSFQALDAATGQVLWQTYMTPIGYSGAAIWGSTAALDSQSNTVYVTTGNNYSLPQSVIDCINNAGSNVAQQKLCLDPNNHVDSILALDMTTGVIKWATQALDLDNWNVACIFNGTNCPANAGPDFDFGSGPNLFTIPGAKGKPQSVVGAGQKSGQYWTLDAATGAVIWKTQVGPGSSLGGIEWGSATDGQRIYVAIGNFFRLAYPGHPELGQAGSFAALDLATGAILWQVADPNAGVDLAAVSTSNGVVFAGSMSGKMLALNAATGGTLWSYQGAGSSNAGAAIDDNGTVYWGNGYGHLGPAVGTPGNTFYAFSAGGQ